MATLLVRTPEVADAEKLAIANVERAWQHNEKSLGRGEQEGQHKASGEVRSRARKGKPGQKKQPQRGLGVAQLEKLRLQEQSKQEAACLASLQSLPSMGFTDQNQNGAMYLRHMKGAISHHHANGRHGSALAFGNGRLGPPDKLAEYLGREGHRHVGKGSMDGDAFRTFMSLASTDHSRSVSLSRHERDHSVSIMLPRRKDDSEMSFICSNYPQAVTLGNNVHPSPSSVNNPGTEGSPTSSPASSALAYVASPPNSSVRESSFFSSALVSRASSANSHPSNAEIGDEKRSSAEVDMPHKSVLHGFSPVSNKGVMEVGMINTKLFPVIMTAGAGGAPIFAVTNLQCFESSSGPAIVDRLPQESTNVPLVVGVTANCDGSKELSSVQSFSSDYSWSALNKSCGWKRPWQGLHESTCEPLHSNRLDLNALAGEIDAADKDCGSAAVALGQQSAVEAHHPEVLIRTAIEGCSSRPLKIRLCGAWDETQSSETAAVRDVGFCSDELLLKGRTYEWKRKESCSSVFPPNSLTIDRRRCFSSPEIQLLTGSDRQKSTGDFLTLGLSSYSASAQHEDEVNSQEAVTPEGTKQVDICSKEGHDVLQLQLCNPQQAQVQQMGSYPVVADEFISGEARLSYNFSSLSSGSLTEHCRRQTERRMEESLDLRLKLAL